MPGLTSLGSLWPYLRPWRRRLVFGLLCAVAASAILPISVVFLERATDDISARAPLRHTYLMAAAVAGVALASAPFRYGMRELLNGVSRYVEYDLRNALLVHLEQLDATYYGRTRTGDIMARLTNDLSAVRMAAGPAIMYLVSTVAGAISALVLMLLISVKLTALALIPLVVLPPIVVRLGRAIHSRFEAVQEHFGVLTIRAQENLSGTRIVRAYRQEEAEIARFGKLNDEYLAKNMRLAWINGVMWPTFSVLAGLGAVVALGFGGVLTTRGAISVGEFLGFGILLTMLTWPLIAFGWVINLFERGAASMGRLNEIFAERSMLTEPDHPRALPALGSGVGGRAIEFRNVSFHYPQRPGEPLRWVLRDVSFTVPAGATLGVVGATGSGKSALIDLIPRLYDPQEGDILVDGVPLRELPIAALRRAIGMVPQESLLFSDTIASNLTYGRDIEVAPIGDDSGLGVIGEVDDETRGAAHVAQLDATVVQFPGGYGTMLGERGINLSGGQKQRAALARALARRPAIVLLDDALSAVDTHTEAEILRALREAVNGRTTVIASHRVSAIRDATWIVVLDEGRIVEQGRHEDLLALGGRYWSLLRRQQLADAIESDAA
jgi:ATP-binding cassette, subfamily B, multidrug efflux pump